MEFKVTTEFEGQTVAGKIGVDGVQLRQLLGKEMDTYVPLIILEDLVEELQSVLYKVEELKGEKLESSDTERDEFEQLGKILDDVSKVFNSAVFVGNKEYKNALKSKGFNFL